MSRPEYRGSTPGDSRGTGDRDEQAEAQRRGMVVGVDCLPLRCIDGLVDGKYPVECTLDSGAQLIAMRRAIWTDLS